MAGNLLRYRGLALHRGRINTNKNKNRQLYLHGKIFDSFLLSPANQNEQIYAPCPMPPSCAVAQCALSIFRLHSPASSSLLHALPYVFTFAPPLSPVTKIRSDHVKPFGRQLA